MMDQIGSNLNQSSLIFATHDVSLALEFASRVIVIEHGQIKFDGPPRESVDAIDGVPPWVQFCTERQIPVTAPEFVCEWAND